MPPRASFIVSTAESSKILQNPQKAIRMVHRWYKPWPGGQHGLVPA